MAVRLRAVCEALQAAFSEAEFERVLLDFGANLDDLAAPGAWPSRVYEVVLWAQRSGRLGELVKAAHAANPGNAALRELAGESVTEHGGVGTAKKRMDNFEQTEYGNGVQRQLGKLSSDVAHLQEDFKTMKDDLTAIRNMLQGRGRESWGNVTWWAAMLLLAGLGAVATVVAARLP